MSITPRFRRVFDTSAHVLEYAELSTPPAGDGQQGDWAVCYGSGSPVTFGPKPSDTAWGAAVVGSTVAWATGTAYSAGQVVTFGGYTYTAVSAHTAGSAFRTDLAGGKWAQNSAPNGGLAFTVNPKILSGYVAYPAALRAYYFRVTDATAFSNFLIDPGVTSGNLLIAAYANNGSRGTAAAPAAGGLIASTGSVAVGTSLAVQTVSAGGTFGLAAGDWIMLSCDNTTAKFRTIAASGLSGSSQGLVGYEVLGSLAAPTNPNPTVWAANYSPWVAAQ